MKISEKIKFLRKETKLNQISFAELMKVTQSTISKYEKGERDPEYSFLQNLMEELKVNPLWLFFNEFPIYLEKNNFKEDNYNYFDLSSFSENRLSILQDLDMLYSEQELDEKLNSILVEKIIDKFTSDNVPSIDKIFSTIKIDSYWPKRPFLFMYYIFRYILENEVELNKINNYKEYLKDLVERYNVLTWSNNPGFTSKMKEQILATIELEMNEKDCKFLILNYKETLKKIESKMTSMMLLSHRKINLKALFPK